MGRQRKPDETQVGLPSEFAEQVLDLVSLIPAGRVMTYGQVADHLGSAAARAVGTTMARYGSSVPWHRVVRSDGQLPAGHEVEALARHRREGTAMRPDGVRVDLDRARWLGPTQSDGSP